MKKEKKPEVKKVEKPKVEEKKKPEVKEEKSKAKKKEKEKKPKGLGSLGVKNIKIQTLGKKVLNGVEYNDIQLADGRTMLLSDKDLEKQLNK